jgi:3-oxoacyl-[acyl-carrier-protein] synthase II
MTPSGPYVVGWSTLSALGTGRREFIDGLLAGRTGCLAEPADAGGGPAIGYPVAPDPAGLLGNKGTRTLDRMTLLVIATARMVLEEQSGALYGDRAAAGLVLGTSTGSVASITEFTRDTFVRDRPYLVDPAAFPNTVINGAAGRSAVWHGLQGLNSTVSAGHVTGLTALRYASRMIRRGYADTLLVGAVEEYSTPVARAVSQLPDADTATPLGEGCVMFLLTGGDPGGSAVAELLDFEFGVTDPERGPGPQGERLAASIRDLLRRHGVQPADLWLVSLAQGGGERLDAAERTAVDTALSGASGTRRVVAAEQVGNTFSALGGFQLAAVLALSGTGAAAPSGTGAAAPRSRISLITSLGTDGAVACALVRT